MTGNEDLTALAPLLALGADAANVRVRVAALTAASHFPLGRSGWDRVAASVRHIVRTEPPGSESRRAALALAARIPLRSVREGLREMAASAAEADADAIAAALDKVADPSRIPALLAGAAGDGGACFEALAAMPVEDVVTLADLPGLPPEPTPVAPFWHALVLARLGRFDALDGMLLDAAKVPALFYGSPWAAYEAIARIRPVPPAMHQHLLGLLERARYAEDAAPDALQALRLTAWAATGVADAEGRPLAQGAGLGARADAAPTPSRGRVRGSARIGDALALHDRLPAALFDEQPPPALDCLRWLPPAKVAALVVEVVEEGHRRAAALPEAVPANEVLGNAILELCAACPAGDDWPVAELIEQQLRARRPAVDDGQLAAILACAPMARLISEVVARIVRQRSLAEQLWLLSLLGQAAQFQAGQGGSAYRGAGPDTAAQGRIELIDDLSVRVAMVRSRGFAGAEPQQQQQQQQQQQPAVEEARRVQARILNDGKPRKSFVGGAENVIRCWIGLPEQQATVADAPIAQVAIPSSGLELTVELSWRDSQGVDHTDSSSLRLPPERSARTADCDLRLQVPAGETEVAALILFRYRGRAFEAVQLRAAVLPAGVAESPGQEIEVKVQFALREVIELPDRTPFDGTLICGPASLRVFNGTGGRIYDLSKARVAVSWLNEQLFKADKSLVRKREGQGGAAGAPGLDGDDAEVRGLLRDMARHGSAIYNLLRAQGFRDPGPRLQLLNLDPSDYTPLEFVYDRGYPADDARLCEGWQAAAEGEDCPVCSRAVVAPEDEDWRPTVCPLGFWSLRKIIERRDPEQGQNLSAPSTHRRALRPLDSVVFASSEKVPQAEREATAAALQGRFANAVMAENWPQWKAAMVQHPPLLLAMPHHDVDANLDFLQIGAETLPPRLGRLSLGQLSAQYVNPDERDPGPIVLLLGCLTGAETDSGYVQLARQFQSLHAAIVVGTLAQVLGRHAAPLARELVAELVATEMPDTDFGSLMRRVRRRMLARGYLMALCLVALGDAEWHLAPRASAPEPPLS
ncbi:MAG: hypothetical protein J0M28_07495 [Thauera sp.]|nr:hypothetical protein [Thauera sp.]